MMFLNDMDNFVKKHIHELAQNLIQQTGDHSALQEIKNCSGGNNQSWIVHTEVKSYFLKHYFFSKKDKRDRLGVEKAFARLADSSGVSNIPGLLAVDERNLFGLFQFIDGRGPLKEEIDSVCIEQALDFIKKINSKNENFNKQFVLYASDSCFSMAEHVTSLESRFHVLQNIAQTDAINLEAKNFVENVLYPEWEELRFVIKEKTVQSRIDFNKRLCQEEMIISPSDFGFHNSIVTKDNLFFIDFEYAGWDDPAKLICDFFCQPEVPVPLKYFECFVDQIVNIINRECKLVYRVEKLLPLYRIKWCCIMLNDFISACSLRKQFAFGREDRRKIQLAKAIRYFKIWF